MSASASYPYISSLASWLRESLRRVWIPTSPEALARAENSYLHGPQLPSDVLWKQRNVDIGGGLHMSTLSAEHLGENADDSNSMRSAGIESTSSSRATPVVFLPGFGGGSAMYKAPVYALSRRQANVYAVDWLGFGRSSRPATDFSPNKIGEVEDFFVESLERWRVAMGFEKLTICGHSLGGYFAACYALRYPDRLSHLVLASPVGVPDEGRQWPPPDMDKRFSWWIRGIIHLVTRMWEYQFTPLGFVRVFGPFGPNVVRWFINRRFAGLDNRELLAEYAYQLSAARGSGEYALTALLYPGGHARSPLKKRLYGLQVPTTFVYGEHDWMNPAPAEELAAAAGDRVSVKYIGKAGHQLFLENPDGFDFVMEGICKSVDARSDA